MYMLSLQKGFCYQRFGGTKVLTLEILQQDNTAPLW